MSSRPLTPKVQYLLDQKPGKIVVDMPNSVFPPVRQEISPGEAGIGKIRISQFQHDPPAVRLVLDLNARVDVAVSSRQVGQLYETRIEPTQTAPESDPSESISGKQQLLNLRLVGQNLVMEGNAPIYPEVRQLNTAQGEYLLTLYDFSTTLDGPQPQLQSSLIESVTVLRTTKGVQLRLRVKRKDLEVIPFSEDKLCTLQFLVTASERNVARLNDLQMDELDAQTTRLRLYADKAFDHQIYPLENPHRLVIDTQGTVIGQPGLERNLRSSQNIRNIRMAPTHADKQTDVRVVLDLLGEVTYRYEQHQNYLEITLQGKAPPRAPVIITPQNRRAFVVIDAGHGGNDPGAIGTTRNQEKIITLAVSQYLQRYLENDNIQAVLTRSEDLEVLLQPRVDVANLRNADLFISIHCNSMPPGNTHVRGIETYYTTPQSKDLADTLHRYIVKELGAIDRRVRQRGLFVTRKAKMPSVLLEIGFLSSPDEEALLANPAYQRQVAKAIRDGIYDYLSRHQKLKPGV
ncbi:MAG: N-acetylmuramoyl-L-alanine amidase [Candidatus Sericytochromatia bacterium]